MQVQGKNDTREQIKATVESVDQNPFDLDLKIVENTATRRPTRPQRFTETGCWTPLFCW